MSKLVGREEGCTLAMAVEKKAEIAAFQPETFYQVQLHFDGFTVSKRLKRRKKARKRGTWKWKLKRENL